MIVCSCHIIRIGTEFHKLHSLAAIDDQHPAIKLHQGIRRSHIEYHKLLKMGRALEFDVERNLSRRHVY